MASYLNWFEHSYKYIKGLIFLRPDRCKIKVEYVCACKLLTTSFDHDWSMAQSLMNIISIKFDNSIILWQTSKYTLIMSQCILARQIYRVPRVGVLKKGDENVSFTQLWSGIWLNVQVFFYTICSSPCGSAILGNSLRRTNRSPSW